MSETEMLYASLTEIPDIYIFLLGMFNVGLIVLWIYYKIKERTSSNGE